jgi:hypothetical protein
MPYWALLLARLPARRLFWILLHFDYRRMNPFFLRVLLAAGPVAETAAIEHYLHDAGHEMVRVDACGDAPLKAARLVHPDLVLLSSSANSRALAEALQQQLLAPTPILVVTDPAELPGLLARQIPAAAWPCHSEASTLPDAAA